MKPLVSIIIPTYNDLDYVTQAVESALCQNYRNTEIIVIDDGSTDNTREVLRGYEIKYIYQENKGLSGARNTGLKSAQGRYITLLDADDLYHKDRIKNQVEFLENNPGYDFCYSGVWHFKDGEFGKFLKLKYKYHSGDIFKQLLKKNFIAPSSIIFRREVIDKIGYFDESYRCTEDFDFWLRAAWAGYRFYHLDKALTYLRIRQKEASLGGRVYKYKLQLNFIRSLRKIRDQMNEAEREKHKIDKYIFFHTAILLLANILESERPRIIKYLISRYLLLRDRRRWTYQIQG